MLRRNSRFHLNYYIGLVLSGCTTAAAAATTVYLISLSYKSTPISKSDGLALVNPNISAIFVPLAGDTSLEVRASYFGLCIRGGRDSSLWTCSDDTTAIARQYQLQEDPLNLIWLATRFKNGITFSGLMYFFLLFMTSPRFSSLYKG